LTQIWLPIVPDGTKSAASRRKSAATRSCRRLTVGSSPSTSSPTSACAIARRMSAHGRVTVSLRKSDGPVARAHVGTGLRAPIHAFMRRSLFEVRDRVGVAQPDEALAVPSNAVPERADARLVEQRAAGRATPCGLLDVRERRGAAA
jgi:hypothetical protein